MKIGTKSVLIGAHCFFLHPFFVARAWTHLYGYPLDPRLWACFFLHDFGYWGQPNMDGPEGETHPEFGANIIRFFFGDKWGDFCMLHSRYYAKKMDRQPSKLCFADKLSFVYTPRWLYLPMVTFTGEINEYLQNGQKNDSPHWTPTNFDRRGWNGSGGPCLVDPGDAAASAEA